MSKEKAEQAIADLDRISGAARECLEKEEWLELAGTFSQIERIGHQGFNLAYDLCFPQSREPQPEPEEPGARRQDGPLETPVQSPLVQYLAPGILKSPTRPEGCTDRCRHNNEEPPKSYLVDPKDGVHIRISFPDDSPSDWGVDRWYRDGLHTREVNEFRVIRFQSGCLYNPCTDCQEDIGRPCTCGYRDED